MAAIPALLTQAGVLVKVNDIRTNFGATAVFGIKKRFTLTAPLIRGGSPYPKHMTLTKVSRSISDDYLVLPRHGSFAFAVANKFIIKNCLPIGANIPTGEFKCTLTENQQCVLSYLSKIIFTPVMQNIGAATCVLEMQAGYGKTFLASAIIHSIGKKTLYIVPTEYLLNQTFDVLTKTLPHLKIGKYYGKKKEDGDIIIAIINSVVMIADKTPVQPKDKTPVQPKGKTPVQPKDKTPVQPKADVAASTVSAVSAAKQFKAAKPPKVIFDLLHVMQNFGLIIYDEIHKYCSDKFMSAFSFAQARSVLCMSATTKDRVDTFDEAAIQWFGPRILAQDIPGFAAPPEQFCTHSVIVHYRGNPDCVQTVVSERGAICVQEMIKRLTSDEAREQILINATLYLYHLGRNIFIFVEHRQMAQRLSDAIKSHLQPTEHANIIIEADIDKKEADIDKKEADIDKKEADTDKKEVDTDTDDIIIDAMPEANPDAAHILTNGAEANPDASHILTNDAEANPDASHILTNDAEANPDADANPDDVHCLIGGAKEEDIDAAIANGRVIFTTYGYSSVGVSIPIMDTLIVATPRRRGFKQIIGRIHRLGGNASIPRLIIDMYDIASLFKQQIYVRKKEYIAAYNVITHKANANYQDVKLSVSNIKSAVTYILGLGQVN
jgi:hypothetical protein